MQKSGFAKALCSDARSAEIPSEHDFFAPLIGDWDIWWTDGLQSGTPREVRGEWLFAQVLDGYAVQDVFIVPSRTQRLANPQPDAEYGTTIRIYEPASGTWDIFYGCVGTALRLTAHKEAEEIVLVQNGEGATRYVFSGMSEASFSWRKELRSDAGLWQVVARVRARRKA